MPMQTVNGRQVFIPDAGISGEDLTKQVKPNIKAGRGGTIIKGPNATRIDPNKKYKPSDLIDKFGKPVKIGDMPDRTKGGFITDLLKVIMGNESNQQKNEQRGQNNYQNTSNVTRTNTQRTTGQTPINNINSLFWGNRTALSKRIIIEQCEDITNNRFKDGTVIDYENAHTFVVNNFLLPSRWHSVSGVVNNRTSLAIVFPTEYPKIAPIGFYLKATIKDAPNGHFYQQAYHDADKLMLNYGWKWYCVYVNQGSWQPASYRKQNDWRYGDNIWTYFDLIAEALTSND